MWPILVLSLINIDSLEHFYIFLDLINIPKHSKTTVIFG